MTTCVGRTHVDAPLSLLSVPVGVVCSHYARHCTALLFVNNLLRTRTANARVASGMLFRRTPILLLLFAQSRDFGSACFSAARAPHAQRSQGHKVQ
jgi:hypothetical protein